MKVRYFRVRIRARFIDFGYMSGDRAMVRTHVPRIHCNRGYLSVRLFDRVFFVDCWSPAL